MGTGLGKGTGPPGMGYGGLRAHQNDLSDLSRSCASPSWLEGPDYGGWSPLAPRPAENPIFRVP